MPFAAALRESLKGRRSEAPAEFRRGDTLEEVLNRLLLTVEYMGGEDVFTCILLLSGDGKRLSCAAAPTVPASFCRASDSIEIGLSSGSCGAAAHLGRPVYSIDIETDPLWTDSRDLALEHGFRSSWSTPIRNLDGVILGTFAILHRAAGRPTREEIEAIELITEHVADAIMWSRDPRYLASQVSPSPEAPLLRLVSDNQEAREPTARLLALAEKLLSMAADLEGQADRLESSAAARDSRDAVELSRKLVAKLISEINAGQRPDSSLR